MSVKIIDNTAKIVFDFRQNASIFLRYFADEVIKIAEPNTPTDTGRLKKDVLRQVLGLNGKIKWQKTYAAIQETKQFRHYSKAGTGPHYAQNAVELALQSSQQIAKKANLL